MLFCSPLHRGAWLLALVTIVILCRSAFATTAPVAVTGGLPDRAQPMRVVIVRDTTPGCTPTCAEWIAAQGKIEPGTRAVFDRVLHALGTRRLPIFIDSLGGSVNDAIAIGRHIRARHLDVVVTRTAFDTCTAGATPCPRPPRDGPTPGRPHGIGSLCASACVLVLAAGTKREAAPWTIVGVHQMIVHETMTRMQRMFRVLTRTVDGRKYEVSRTLVSERPVATMHFDAEPSRGLYDTVGAYLSQMGIAPAMMPLMRATPSILIHRLTREEEAATAIVTDPVDGEYVAGASRIAVLPARPASVPEQAFYVVASADPAKPKVSVGRVVWSLEPSPSDPTSDAHATLRADADIPDIGLGLVLRIAPPQSALPPVIDVAFTTTPTSVEIRGIQRIGAPQARAVGPIPLYTLAATVRSVGDKSFQIHLTGGSARWVVDQGMINDRPWIDIPMLVNGATIAKITIEHAASGTPLVRRVLQAWSTADHGPTATGPVAPKP